MRFVVASLTVLALAACSSTLNNSGQGLVDPTVMRQQVVRDVQAILQGINETHARVELQHQQAQ